MRLGTISRNILPPPGFIQEFIRRAHNFLFILSSQLYLSSSPRRRRICRWYNAVGVRTKLKEYIVGTVLIFFSREFPLPMWNGGRSRQDPLEMARNAVNWPNGDAGKLPISGRQHVSTSLMGLFHDLDEDVFARILTHCDIYTVLSISRVRSCICRPGMDANFANALRRLTKSSELSQSPGIYGTLYSSICLPAA